MLNAVHAVQFGILHRALVRPTAAMSLRKYRRTVEWFHPDNELHHCRRRRTCTYQSRRTVFNPATSVFVRYNVVGTTRVTRCLAAMSHGYASIGSKLNHSIDLNDMMTEVM